LFLRVDRLQFRSDANLDAVVGCHGVQDVGELILVVDALTGSDEDDPDLVQASLLPPVVGRQVHDLLGGAGTFDQSAGAAEDNGSGGDPTQDRPGLLRIVEGVVARDPIRGHRFGQAGQSVPVQLDPGSQDQSFVSDAIAVGQADFAAVRIDLSDSAAHPADSTRHHLRLRLDRAAHRLDARTHEAPGRLVVVDVGGLDHDDSLLMGPTQSCGHRQAAGASADDEDACVERRLCAHAVYLPVLVRALAVQVAAAYPVKATSMMNTPRVPIIRYSFSLKVFFVKP